MKKNNKNNPARVFADSLSTAHDAKVTINMINYLCKIHNSSNVDTLDWSSFDYTCLLSLRRKLTDKKLKSTTINNYISKIKSVCRESWRLGIISTDNYMRINDIKGIKGSSARTGQSLDSTTINYLSSLDDSTKNLRDSALIAIIYGCGLRSAEATNIQFDDINGNKILVLGKGRVERHVYMPSFTKNILKKWLNTRGSHSGYIFNTLNKGGKILSNKISCRTVADIIDCRCKKLNVKRFTPHDLRRSFATNLLKNGVDVFIVQDLMRHANIATTRVYDYRDDDAKIAAVEMLPF